MKRKNLAFSMAEVMITLVILGVIAVLTVPGLVDSANKRINEAAASKADYVIGQAALRLQAECPRLRSCADGNSAPQNLARLLESVKANEKLTYKVSAKTDNNNIFVLVTIEGDDVPILFKVDNVGKGAIAENSDISTANGLKIYDSNSTNFLPTSGDNKIDQVKVKEGIKDTN